MDLCLRLRAAGWMTICLPEPILIHHESASRGTAADFDVAYGRERRAFHDRWYPYIRNDPYFHPALSLHSIAAALDR
jgi:O-antigen biosynthesis protein